MVFAGATFSGFERCTWAAEPQSGTSSGVAGAQAKATAEDLYQQGMALLRQGKWSEAAAKLEESNRVDPAPGTTVNLADCYEHMGRLASAWTLFVDAATVFGRRNPPDPRGEKAKARAEALYPRLARLTLSVSESVRALPGVIVKRDGVEVGAAQFGTGIAVDPGPHTVEVNAPGKKAWRKEVKVEGDAASVTVTVGQLEDAPKDGGAAPPSDDPTGGAGSARSGQEQRNKLPGFLLGGVGVGGLAVGAGLIAMASGLQTQNRNEAPQDVAGNPTCNRGAVAGEDAKCADLRVRADSINTLGNAGVGVLIGGGVFVASAAIYLLIPSKNAPETLSSRIVPVAGRDGAGLVWSGSF